MTSPPPPAGCNNWGAIFCMVSPLTQEASRMDKCPMALAPLRRVPRQVSWVDQRLGRERYIDQLSHEACALYLFLVPGADAQGLRYYADASRWRRWSRTSAALHQARQALRRRGLVAYHRPLSQVFALDTAPREAAPRA